MTDLLTRPVTEPSVATVSPKARRWRRSRWRDGRLAAGVLLMLVSVVVGARVVGGATESQQWLALTRPVPAGHLLAAEDLTAVGAHLPSGAGGQYFTAEPAELVGRTVTRALAAGELLPSAAVATKAREAGRVLPLVVQAGRLPQLQAGDRVDVYVMATATDRGAAGKEIRVLHDVEFVDADVLGSGDTSVELRVSPADVVTAVAASQSERVDVVRIERDGTGSPGDAGPSSAPAYGGGR